MNKILVSFTSLIWFSTAFSQTSATEDYKKRNNYFYVGPAELFLNTFQLGYEKKLKCHNSLFLSGGFKLSESDEVINRMGGNAEIQYRINLLYNKEAIGLINKNYSTFVYFAPYIQYRYEEIKDADYSDISKKYITTFVNSSFGGLGFGIRLTAVENRFCINIFGGGGLKYSEVNGLKKYGGFMEPGYTGIAPKLSLQMGIAF